MYLISMLTCMGNNANSWGWGRILAALFLEEAWELDLVTK